MSIKIGDCKAEPGSMVQGFLDITTSGNGVPVSIPMIIICGVQPGPTILVNGTIHGDEPEGFQTVLKLGKILNPKKMKGNFIGFPVLNWLGFPARMHYNPIQHRGRTPIDMNRMAPGREDGTIDEKIIYKYCNEIIPKADYLVDLHGTGFCTCPAFIDIPAPPKLGLAKESLEFAIASGIQFITKGYVSPDTSLMTYATKNGVIATQTEAGTQADTYIRRDFYVNSLVEAVMNKMKYLGILEGPRKIPIKPFWKETKKTFARENVQYLVKHIPLPVNFGGLFVPKVRPGEEAEKGQILAEIVKPFWGEVLQTLKAPDDGVCFGMNAYALTFPGAHMSFGKILEIISPE